MKIFARLVPVEKRSEPHVPSIIIKCFKCGKELWLCKHCYDLDNDHDVIGFCNTHNLTPEQALNYWKNHQK